MDPHLDVPHTLHVEPVGAIVEAPALMVGPLHRIPSILTTTPREPRTLTQSASAIETLEDLVEAGERTPEHRYAPCQNVWADPAQTGQRPVLLIAGHPAAFPPPCHPALLQGRVVQLALYFQQCLERRDVPDRR